MLFGVMMALLMPARGLRYEPEEMIPLLKRHEVQVLLQAGFSVMTVGTGSAGESDGASSRSATAAGA